MSFWYPGCDRLDLQECEEKLRYHKDQVDKYQELVDYYQGQLTDYKINYISTIQHTEEDKKHDKSTEI